MNGYHSETSGFCGKIDEEFMSKIFAIDLDESHKEMNGLYQMILKLIKKIVKKILTAWKNNHRMWNGHNMVGRRWSWSNSKKLQKYLFKVFC